MPAANEEECNTPILPPTAKELIRGLLDTVFAEPPRSKVQPDEQNTLFTSNHILGSLFEHLECCRRGTREVNAYHGLGHEIAALKQRRDAAVQAIDHIEQMVLKIDGLINDKKNRRQQLMQQIGSNNVTGGRLFPFAPQHHLDEPSRVDSELSSNTFELRTALRDRLVEAETEINELRQQCGVPRFASDSGKRPSRQAVSFPPRNCVGIGTDALWYYFSEARSALLKVVFVRWHQHAAQRRCLQGALLRRSIERPGATTLKAWTEWRRCFVKSQRAHRLLPTCCLMLAAGEEEFPIQLCFGAWKTRTLQLWRREAHGYAQRCQVLHKHATRCNSMTRRFASKFFAHTDAALQRAVLLEWWKGAVTGKQERAKAPTSAVTSAVSTEEPGPSVGLRSPEKFTNEDVWDHAQKVDLLATPGAEPHSATGSARRGKWCWFSKNAPT